MRHLVSRGLHVARALAAGGLAGLAALGADELLAVLTLGFAVPLETRHVVAYVALGAAGSLVWLIVALARRHSSGGPRPDGWAAFAVGAAGIYAPAIFERVYHVLGHRNAAAPGIATALLAVVGYGIWIAVLWRAAGGRRGAGQAGSVAPALGAAGAAVGLAVNRNLVDLPLEPLALAADAGVLTGTLGLAFLARKAGVLRAVAVLAGLAAIVAGAVTLGRGGASSPATPAEGAPAAGAPAAGAPAAGDRPPNLVLVIIDTLRQDSFANVVRYTEEGRTFRKAMAGSAWFSRAVAAAPWTVPSVGSIMTGLYPKEHGFHSAPVKSPSRPLRPLAETVPTLAQKLERRGYWTEAIGTNPLLQPVSGIARGFAHYEILSGPTVKLPPLTALLRLGLLGVDNYQEAGSVRRRLSQRLGPMTASAKPIFLWLHLMDPHSPLKSHRGLTPDPRVATYDEPRRLYHDEVRYALRELTSMLRMLRDHGLWRDTVLVVVSDHGEMFPADGHDVGVTTLDRTRPKLYGHGHAMYAELVNVPLVIRPPGGLPKSRRVTTLTSHVDMHDTILDLLDHKGERIGGERVSLAPWLGVEAPVPAPRSRKRVLIGANQHGPKQRALRTHRFKLIDYLLSSRPSELYNSMADRGERRDLASLDPRRLARLERSLENAWEELPEAPPADPAELDAETLKRLKALGYVP